MVLYNFKHVSAHVALYMFIRVFLNQHNELIGIVSLINSLRSIIYHILVRVNLFLIVALPFGGK